MLLTYFNVCKLGLLYSAIIIIISTYKNVNAAPWRKYAIALHLSETSYGGQEAEGSARAGRYPN